MIKENRKKIDRNAEPDWAGLAKLEDTCVDKEKQGAIITTNERDRIMPSAYGHPRVALTPSAFRTQLVSQTT
jgi:hypothetical protein